MGGKAPAFQFYVKDWLTDPQLRMASTSTRGIWIDLLCYMWEAEDRGQVTGTDQQFIKLLGCTPAEWDAFIREISTLKFGDISDCNADVTPACDVTCNANVTLRNKNVTLVNRRMRREHISRNNTRLRVKRFRSNAQCNANVTHASSSSSSSPIKEEKKIHICGDAAGTHVTPPGEEGNGTQKKAKSKHQPSEKKVFGVVVKLTDAEHEKLISRFGAATAQQYIDALDLKLQSKFVRYSSHYATILNYERLGYFDKLKGVGRKGSIFDD